MPRPRPAVALAGVPTVVASAGPAQAIVPLAAPSSAPSSYKSRLKDRSARKAYAVAANEALATLDVPSYVIEAPPMADDEELEAFNPVIIAEATKSLRRLSVSEAVMELDLTGAAVVVFLHGTSGRVNLIYRRADGNIGWVDPPTVNS